MRNLFDQYKDPENRLTHALACCLDEDRKLLRQFIAWTTNKRLKPSNKLYITEQHIPGQLDPDQDIDEQRGLPDMWIFDEENEWSLIMESKVASSVSTNQLRRHVKTARMYGFDDITLLVISPELPRRQHEPYIYITWPEVYKWMRRRAAKSQWAQRFVDYIQIAEVKMTADGYLGDKNLTEFDGIPFNADHPFSYREGKRIIKLLMPELCKRKDLRKLGIDPDRPGRTAITGSKGNSVWDFLWVKQAENHQTFTSHPHLTLSIQQYRLLVMITIPNGIKTAFRNNLKGLDYEQFQQLVVTVSDNIEKTISPINRAFPVMEVVQRHYPSQRSSSITDAMLEFDLRTAKTGTRKGVKYQDQWLKATHEAMCQKKSNIQFGIGAIIPFGSDIMNSRKIIDHIAGVWIACKPWLDRTLKAK